MPDTPEGAIVITTAQMYADMQKDIGAIRAALEDQKVNLSGVPAMLADHEQRIRILEKAKWLIAGFCAAGGGGIGVIATKLLGG